ncbi:MAG TPA: hypothetical protein VK566_10030 [Nitrososphaeraceae archaeon]|nr:hypothetical protein [Nitrososphaeraceae archaeon]
MSATTIYLTGTENNIWISLVAKYSSGLISTTHQLANVLNIRQKDYKEKPDGV